MTLIFVSEIMATKKLQNIKIFKDQLFMKTTQYMHLENLWQP